MSFELAVDDKSFREPGDHRADLGYAGWSTGVLIAKDGSVADAAG